MKAASPQKSQIAFLLVGCLVGVGIGMALFWPSNGQSESSGTSTSGQQGPSKMELLRKATDRMRKRREARQLAASKRFNAKEKELIEETVDKKLDLRFSLLDQVEELRKVVRDDAASDENVAASVAALLQKKQDIENELAKLDSLLAEQVSMRAKARLLITGALDNGLGLMYGSQLQRMQQMQPGNMQQMQPGNMQQMKPEDMQRMQQMKSGLMRKMQRQPANSGQSQSLIDEQSDRNK